MMTVSSSPLIAEIGCCIIWNQLSWCKEVDGIPCLELLLMPCGCEEMIKVFNLLDPNNINTVMRVLMFCSRSREGLISLMLLDWISLILFWAVMKCGQGPKLVVLNWIVMVLCQKIVLQLVWMFCDTRKGNLVVSYAYNIGYIVLYWLLNAWLFFWESKWFWRENKRNLMLSLTLSLLYNCCNMGVILVILTIQLSQKSKAS